MKLAIILSRTTWCKPNPTALIRWSLYTHIWPYTSLRESYGAGSKSAWYHELGRPSGIYNWKIGLLAVDRFFSTHQFDEALQIARLIFDPTIEWSPKRVRKPRTTNHAGAFLLSSTWPEGWRNSAKILLILLISPTSTKSSSLLSKNVVDMQHSFIQQPEIVQWLMEPLHPKNL